MPEQISYRHELLRKAIHLCSLWMVVSLTTIPRTWNVILFGALLLILVAVEYGNHRKWRLFTATYGRFFGRLLRAQETGETFQLSGAPHVLAAALMCALLFEYRIAAIALSTMLIGDTGAALVGRKWGKHKINAGRKSVEGAATFWVCSFCVLLCFVWLYALPLIFILTGIFGISIAMLAEVYEKQIRMDDNFSIPLAMGIALSLTRFL